MNKVKSALTQGGKVLLKETLMPIAIVLSFCTQGHAKTKDCHAETEKLGKDYDSLIQSISSAIEPHIKPQNEEFEKIKADLKEIQPSIQKDLDLIRNYRDLSKDEKRKKEFYLPAIDAAERVTKALQPFFEKSFNRFFHQECPTGWGQNNKEWVNDNPQLLRMTLPHGTRAKAKDGRYEDFRTINGAGGCFVPEDKKVGYWTNTAINNYFLLKQSTLPIWVDPYDAKAGAMIQVCTEVPHIQANFIQRMIKICAIHDLLDDETHIIDPGKPLADQLPLEPNRLFETSYFDSSKIHLPAERREEDEYKAIPAGKQAFIEKFSSKGCKAKFKNFGFLKKTSGPTEDPSKLSEETRMKETSPATPSKSLHQDRSKGKISR